jgi:hypothetical protein
VANPTNTTKRGMDDMEELPGVHGDVTNNACPTPGDSVPFGNITSCPTVCISSIANELQNITGYEGPQGAVEIEDLFKQGKSTKTVRSILPVWYIRTVS